MYKEILYQVKEGVAEITLNRPSVYNALNADICLEMTHAFHQAADDTNVKVVVMKGAGKGFCAGQDLSNILGKKEIIPSEYIEDYYKPLVMAMRIIPKPVICCLHGAAAGAGCSIALAADVIIAAESSYMSQAFVNIGLVPDTGATYFLPKVAGRFRAFEWLTTGNKITAKEAYQFGLVNKVVSDDELEREVNNLVNTYKEKPAKVLAWIKQLLNQSEYASLEDMIDKEGSLQNLAFKTEDFQEGLKAFAEKRKPKFKGK